MNITANNTVAWISILALAAANLCQASPTDYNFDGRVDLGDLAKWQAAFGNNNPPFADHADADGDRDTDGSDFLAWQREREVSTDDELLLPEPRTLMLAVPFMIFLVARRQRPTARRRYDMAHQTVKPSRRMIQRWNIGNKSLGVPSVIKQMADEYASPNAPSR